MRCIICVERCGRCVQVIAADPLDILAQCDVQLPQGVQALAALLLAVRGTDIDHQPGPGLIIIGLIPSISSSNVLNRSSPSVSRMSRASISAGGEISVPLLAVPPHPPLKAERKVREASVTGTATISSRAVSFSLLLVLSFIFAL